MLRCKLFNRQTAALLLGSALLLGTGASLYANAKPCNPQLPACTNGGTWTCNCNPDGSSVCTGGCN
jgi:hypothetical protein